MQFTIDEATDLGIRVLTRYGMAESYARMVAEHLVDAALCGHEFSSLARLPVLAGLLQSRPPAGDIRVIRETPCSALIDGGDNMAYAVSIVAIDKGIDICRKNGLALVCANNTWFSGRLAYYVERAAREGFIALHAVHGTARTAPHGGAEAVMGTNPFAFAFPGSDDPFVIDMATSATTHGASTLARTKGEMLPPGLAIDHEGRPTVDPQAALDGAFLTWGGHRGSALSLALQMLGMLAGSDVVVQDDRGFGLFFLVIDPQLMMPREDYRTRVSQLREIVRSTRPAPGADRVRAPGDTSLNARRRSLTVGADARIAVDDKVYARIQALLT